MNINKYCIYTIKRFQHTQAKRYNLWGHYDKFNGGCSYQGLFEPSLTGLRSIHKPDEDFF